MTNGIRFNPFNGLKCLAHSEKIEQILKGNIPFPVTVEIDASNFCNHDCVWCMYKDFKIENRVSIPPKRLLSLCDELHEVGVKSVTFTGGGEPLANKSVPKAMYKLKELGMNVGLVTNGGFLGDNLIKKAITDNCSFLRISLDAGTNETHVKLHNQADPCEYEKILNYVCDIKENYRTKKTPELGYSFLVHPENFREVDQAIRNASKCFDYIQIRPVLGPKLSYEAVGYVSKKIEEAKHKFMGKFRVYGIMHRFDELAFKDHGFTKCFATPLVGVVGANQKLYLCCQWRGQKEGIIGDISEKSFKEVWGASLHRKVLKAIELDECIPCRYKQYNQVIENVFLKDKMHKDFL